MKSLRVQLLFSHLALVALMGIVMTGAVVNFLRLGRSIDRIFRHNYKSVVAAQSMKEALERMDSAALFHLAGQAQQARAQFREYEPRFDDGLRAESGNITEEGEHGMAKDIALQWADYRTEMERFLNAPPSRTMYFDTLQPRFQALKQRAQDVLELNQAAILRADARAKAEARRASRLAIGITAGALALSLFFTLRTTASSLSPLRSLARQAEEIGAGHLNQRIELHRGDEVGLLAAAFDRMAENLREARRKEEERLHLAERMSDEALQSLYDPVIVTDAQGRVVHLNHAAEGVFGSNARLKGRPVAQAAPDKHIAAAVDRAIRQQRVSAEEGDAALVTVAERAYRLRTTPMRDDNGATLGAVAVLEDVTHLREVDRLKTEFIGVASHELRTPVTSLLLSVQLMEEEAAGPLTQEQREIVATQRQDLERLDHTMRDLLDLTRLEAGVNPPRLQIVAPAELARQATESVAAAAEEKGIHLSFDAAPNVPDVRADTGQMTRALVNLLNNAVRHTPNGGSVRLSVAPRNGCAAFEVRDTGSGIPTEYLKHIFDRFTQVPGATRGGAGLGLSIAQTIVKAHGGELMAESEVGRGSAFTFILAAAETAGQETA